MKYFLAFSLMLAPLCLCAKDSVQIKDIFAKNTSTKNAQYCFYAKYAGGADIADINKNFRLAPASVLKLYTSAAALDILGPDFTFETKLYYGGALKDGTLYGDIYIKGGGDPTLGSPRMPGTPGLDKLMEDWTAQIKAAGIKQVKGGICADNSIFSGVLLPWRTSYQNIGNYFAAPADGLSVRDNSYEIYFEPPQAEGATAKVLKTVPEIKGFDIVSYVTFSKDTKSDDAYVNFVPAKSNIEIYGTLPFKQQAMHISAAMPNPALFFTQYLKGKLEEAGVVTEGGARLCPADTYENKTLILTQTSPKLADILRYTNKRSFNLYADMVLRMIAVKTGKEGRSGSGVAQLKEYLTSLGLDTTDFDVFDGSGLSRDNVTTCALTVGLLEGVLKKPYKDAFMDSLPIVGDTNDSGNMAKRMTRSSAAHNALVKTGSLDRARAHAGYVKDAKGRQIVFCIITNNFAGTLRQTDDAHEAAIDALADIGLRQKPAKHKI